MSQQQKNAPAPQKSEETSTKEPQDVKNEELSDSTNALLDEIDNILEENCEEFVKNYVQRGGE